MNDCFLNLLFSFQLLLPLKDGADFVGSKQTIDVILESFYNLFIYKRFERKDKIEVTSWQPFVSALCCELLPLSLVLMQK